MWSMRVEGVGLRDFERSQDERVEQREDQRVGANRQRQRGHRSQRKSGRLAQCSQGHAQVANENFNEASAHGRIAFFADSLARAELDARAPLRRCAAHPAPCQVVGAEGDMRAQFLFHLPGHLFPMEGAVK